MSRPAAGARPGPSGPEHGAGTDPGQPADPTAAPAPDDAAEGCPDPQAGAAAPGSEDAEAGATAGSGGPGVAGPGDIDPEAKAQEELTAELAELAALRRERDEYLDALRRLQADFENYKKRVLKQQADSIERAAESIVDKLLPALDTADLAVAHADGDELRQVRTAFIDALSREGLERIAPDGGPFDPTRHDAVAHEPGDGSQEIAALLRAGYAWKGRVLRPAMVKVRG